MELLFSHPAALAQSNLPQHYYMCQKNLMVGGKLNTYITGVNWADQEVPDTLPG